jgi:hypothetical protein
VLKKLLVPFLAVAASIVVANTVKAADVYQTINVIGGQYPNIDFYPRTLHVNQGDSLHLTIKNTRLGFTRIFMPAFNLDQDMAPGSVVQLDTCIANPIAKNMWFQISSLGAENVPGTIVTTNYQTPVVATTPRIIDVSVLDPIINYSKEYCFSEKAEPKYYTQKPCPTGAAVRGCW